MDRVKVLEHYQKNKLRYEIAMLLVFFLVNNTILATSVVMESLRANDSLPYALWEPFVWEYSSAVGSLVLFIPIVWLLSRVGFNWQAPVRTLLIYFFASLLYSAAHIAIMVALRKAVYALTGGSYDFGNVWFEFLYEYRKDVWSFIFAIGIIQVYGFILRRLLGEANLVHEGEDERPDNTPQPQTRSSGDRLLVRKLGKEFIIKVEDVEWMESSGNYVNLHIGGRIYPLRATLGKLAEQLEPKGFCRIHRSYAVRLDTIESITPLPSGDSEVRLQCGRILNLSRRYKDEFKTRLQPA